MASSKARSEFIKTLRGSVVSIETTVKEDTPEMLPVEASKLDEDLISELERKFDELFGAFND